MSKELSLPFFGMYCLLADAVRVLTLNSGHEWPEKKMTSFKIFKNQKVWTLLIPDGDQIIFCNMEMAQDAMQLLENITNTYVL